MMSNTSNMDAGTPEAALQRVVYFFEHLQPTDLAEMDRVYTTDAHFKDPFNEVQGLAQIESIFAHMFDALESPHFVIIQQVQQGAQCFVTWDFRFAMRRLDAGRTQTIRGASHLVLREEAGLWKIAVHRDYWDPAEELYEKIPLVRFVMRWLKKKARS